MSYPIGAQSTETDSSTISEHTFLVYRRYYFVARLKKTINLLAHMYQEVSNMQALLAGRTIDIADILPDEQLYQFKHQLIRSSIKQMRQTRNLKPLFMVWDSFAAYKSLYDELFVEEFSKEIFIITRNTIARMVEHTRVPGPYISDEYMPSSIDERIKAISRMTDHIYGDTLKRDEISDLHVCITID